MERTLQAVIVALGIAVSGWLIGTGMESFRMADRSIVIKGLAEQTVDSDFASWSLTVRHAADSFTDVQQALLEDRQKVVSFLDDLGFSADEIEIRPLIVNDVFSREYAPANSPTRFNGSAMVVIASSRVDAIERAALATDPLIAKGVQLDMGAGPRYELRAFNDAKAPLLKAATENARTQAIRFAEESGATLGKLKSANQGVIQITGAGGDQYGSAASRKKRLRVVSTFVYFLK